MANWTLGLSRLRAIRCLLLIGLVAGSARPAAGARLVGAWDFGSAGPNVEDRSGNGRVGTAEGCQRLHEEGRAGQALKLTGAAGMIVPGPLTKGLRLESGFLLDFWLKPDGPPSAAPMNLVTRPGQFMLRVNGAAAGGQIALFVRTEDGQVEPRAAGPVLQPGQWAHVVASWNGHTATLWVNYQQSSAARIGVLPASLAPLLVGGPGDGMAGFRGLVDDLRIYEGAIGPRSLARQVYGIDQAQPAEKRSNPRFEFDSSGEGWQFDGRRPAAAEGGSLAARLSDGGLLKVGGLNLPLAEYPVATIRMAALRSFVVPPLGGRDRRGPTEGRSPELPATGVFFLATDKDLAEIPFRLLPDGRMHDYTLRCRSAGLGGGSPEALGLRVEGTPECDVRVDFVRLDRVSHARPDLRLMSVAPRRRISAVGQPTSVSAWVRNFGGPAADVSLRLSVPQGVTIRGESVERLGRISTDEEKMVAWSVQAQSPLDGEVRVELLGKAGQSEPCGMSRPVGFAADPEEAGKTLADGRAWLRSGYPRSMDFRHLFPGSVPYLEHNTALLVDFTGQKIPAAQEFKRRYPDRLVLMQVNDESNGLWGSWHSVPKEFAIKEGLDCDPMVFPMPEFRGYWLLGPRAELAADFPADQENCTLAVPDVQWFIESRRGVETPRDVLLYRRNADGIDWSTSEYASVVRVDRHQRQIVLGRWPRKAVGVWRSSAPGQACVAPSAGDTYRLSASGPLIKTWVPNLTRFCPRDPATGLDAATWWARHFARLWHERIAASSSSSSSSSRSPHPDGYEFDGLDEGKIGDCDNDGRVDACRIGGVPYWQLGLYDFFRMLREGGQGWRIAPDLVLADASTPWHTRCLGLLNGTENEEFPSFSGPQYFPTGLDLYRVWCAAAVRPSCSYLQGRFSCDSYLEESWTAARSQGKFHHDGLVRLSMASACLGDGIYTYRTGSRRDLDAIADCNEVLEYPWDEYHAGREGHYNWLGLPRGEAVRLTDHLGPDLLPAAPPAAAGGEFRVPSAAEPWKLQLASTGILADGPKQTTADGRAAIEVSVLPIDAAGQAVVRAPAAAGSAVLLSPTSSPEQPLSQDEEYCADFQIWADPGYDWLVGERFAGLPRVVGVALQCGGNRGPVQWLLAGPQWRRVTLTLRTPLSVVKMPARLALLVGAEPGPVRIADLQLRRGCAEVYYRSFEHGLVLVNGSAVSPFGFELEKVPGGRSYRRFSGAQSPDVNDGRPVAATVTVPAQDAALLIAE